MDEPLTKEEGQALLKLARQSLESWVREGKRVPLPLDLPPALDQGLGAFVTLTIGGELRGCIGSMVAHGPLAETVRDMAIAAGNDDPRFPPVMASELGELRYEISVLSPLVEARPESVVPGKHGLYIRKGRASGTLLPQVAAEHGWDRDTFLEQTCVKAGLRPSAWRDPDCTIYTYMAQVFSEDET